MRNVDQLELSRMQLICGLDEARLRSARKSFREAQVTSDVDAVIRSDVEAILIATPVNTHFELARGCV